MPADRIIGSAKFVMSVFMDAEARFPAGPLSVATMKGLDVLAVQCHEDVWLSIIRYM